MENKHNNSIHITLLVILTLFFLILMFLSTSTRNIEISYNFNDDATITQNNYNSKIGVLSVKNSGFLASKIQLTNYKACIFDSNNQDLTYDISYAGSQNSYTDFTGYTPRQFVEIKGNSQKEYSITLNGYYGYPSKYDEKGNLIILNETKIQTLYLFNLGFNDENYYDYCMNAKSEDAFDSIKLTVKYEN